MLKRLSSVLLAAFVIGGLGFGATQLRAGVTTDCQVLGYHGPCDTHGECFNLCIQLFPEGNGTGFCDTRFSCCMCATR
jgi:hypothetical protein